MKEGDLVCIDPKRYAVMKHQDGSMRDGVITDNPIVGYNFNMVNINGETYLYLYDSDVRYVVEDYEEIESEKPKESKIINPKKPIIV